MPTDQGFGRVEDIPLSKLLLDALNPRFHPPASGDPSQLELAIRLSEEDDALVVARSIARHGFYPWEVLVVIEHGPNFIVVEGNRRLTALMGLTDEALRSQLPDASEWHELAAQASPLLDGTAPCVVAISRTAAQPALGYRHISGITPWGPYAQARFIAHMIETEMKSETEVAEVTGKTVGWVRDIYRNYRVTEQAEAWGYDTLGISDSFSLMDVALGQRGIKDFLGVGPASPVEPYSAPVPAEKSSELGELVALIWGDDERDPVITDSRQIRKLGRIINNQAAMASLREGKSLDEAVAEAVDSEFDPIESVINKIDAATRAAALANREIRATRVASVDDNRIASAVEDFATEASQLIQVVDAD